MISRIINQQLVRKAEQLLQDCNKLVIVTHMTPDGDAIGSSLAAYHIFSALGKDVKAVIPDTYLAPLRTLPGAKEIVDASRYPDFARQLFNEADLVLCLDFNDSSRVGRLKDTLEACKAPKILVDHHPHPGLETAVTISYPRICSTCYLLFRLLCRLQLFNDISPEAATCLLAGMMTDTGNFAYNCSDAEIYIVVAELLRKGADKEKLYRDLFNTFSENCLKLNAYAIYRKMEVFPNEHAALITLSREELNRFHYTRGDTEGLVNRPLAIPGVKYCAFMREETESIRVSMRSKDDFPVNKICAEHFGGGGHLNAAGGDFYGTLDEAAKYFRSILEDNKRKYIHK